MGLIKRIFRRNESANIEEALKELEAKLTVWPWDAPLSTPMKVACVYRCVRLLSESVAELPLEVLRRSPAGVFTPYGCDLGDLLSVQPCEDTSAFDFWRQAVQQQILTGISAILPMRNEMEKPERFLLLTPGSCSFDMLNHVWAVNDEYWNIHENFLDRDIIILKEPGDTSRQSAGIPWFADMSIKTASVGDKETHDRFKNGGNVRGFFTNTPATTTGYNPYSDKALKNAAEKNETFFRTGGRMSYLSGAMTFKELYQTSADMQFLESRKFTVTDICRFFQIDPSFVFQQGSSNYKSSENASTEFLKTLNKRLVQIEQELTRKLIPRDRWRSERIRFDRDMMIASDPAEKIALQLKRIEAGIDTPNEARKANNRMPVENGDTPLMSANLKTLSSLMGEGTTETNNQN